MRAALAALYRSIRYRRLGDVLARPLAAQRGDACDPARQRPGYGEEIMRAVVAGEL